MKKNDEDLLRESQELDALYADATGPAEAYDKDVLRMFHALVVLTHAPAIVAWLKANDPKALQQAQDAIDNYAPWLENADGDDPRANGWVDDRGAAMNEHAELALQALSNLKGDDTERYRRAFARFTPEEMQEEHGISGKTRQQWLDMCIKYDAKVDAAIAWVRSKA